jgi:hypothetical protein
MGCRREWNREFLDSIMTKTFVDNEYKKHREEVLFQREKSMLPETMPYVERTVIANGYYAEMKKLQEIKEKLAIEQRNIPYVAMGEDTEKIIKYQTKLTKYQIKKNDLDLNINLLAFKRNLVLGRANSPIIEVRQFVRACPANDCRGFLSSQWKCGLCNVWVCPDCHEIKGENRDANHTCDPNNVATAQLLAKDTKACPKCASMIFKISGCDQMFCVSCQTAFSWNTGRIVTGAIHNPHYYEYLRRTGGGEIRREAGDIPCGGIPPYRIIQAKMKDLFASEIDGNYFRPDTIHRLHQHIEFVEIPHYQTNRVNDNRDLRIRYLMKEIDEKDFKRLLQQREKADNKKQEILMVFQMFLQACADIMQRFILLARKRKDAKQFIDEFEGLREYTNESITKIAKRYKSTPRLIKDTWSMH